MKFHLLTILSLLLPAVGCSVQEPAEWKGWRNRFVLKDKPEGAISISEAITHSAEEEIVVLAQVGSGKGETFDHKLASFLISEAPDPEHAGKPEHDENCPFCKQRLANAPTVTVGFETSEGKAILADARKLFGIKKGDVVLIKGKGSYEESSKMMTINANGLHVVGR